MVIVAFDFVYPTSPSGKEVTLYLNYSLKGCYPSQGDATQFATATLAAKHVTKAIRYFNADNLKSIRFLTTGKVMEASSFKQPAE